MLISRLKTYNWLNSLHGMRSPLQSWHKNDTTVKWSEEKGEMPLIGVNDLRLCKRLVRCGASHRKFLRQIQISCDIKANKAWFAEFDTYLHTVQNSTSMMHTLGKRLLTKDDFSSIDERILNIINEKIAKYQQTKSKEDWRDMIDNIPQGFLYVRTVTFSYEVFLTIYPSRKNHKMEEWRTFCQVLREESPYLDEFLKVLEEK